MPKVSIKVPSLNKIYQRIAYHEKGVPKRAGSEVNIAQIREVGGLLLRELANLDGVA